MKCDELKPLVFLLSEFAVYKATEVDAAIAELKEQYKDMDVTHTVHIAKMNARIEELEESLESEKASRYADSVDANMENRRLKRALWLARAEIAHMKIDEKWPDYCHNAHSRIALLKWEEVERKCRAKADEYK